MCTCSCLLCMTRIWWCCAQSKMCRSYTFLPSTGIGVATWLTEGAIWSWATDVWLVGPCRTGQTFRLIWQGVVVARRAVVTECAVAFTRRQDKMMEGHGPWSRMIIMSCRECHTTTKQRVWEKGNTSCMKKFIYIHIYVYMFIMYLYV